MLARQILLRYNITTRELAQQQEQDPGLEHAFAAHDHDACCARTLDAVERMVAYSGLRLTPVRRRTLEILLEEHRALGAYEVLERLVRDGYGNQPPVAYRALEFLVENGLAHRIRQLNAFAACAMPQEAHDPVFLICSGCDLVAELPGTAASSGLRSSAMRAGFSIENMNVEMTGLCPSCAGEVRP